MVRLKCVMFSVYKLISFKMIQIVSPGTFVNKSESVYDEECLTNVCNPNSVD
jgi:hypothetical protein